MQRHWWEWLLDVPPAGPGQGTSFEFVQHFPWPLWVLLLILAGSLAFVIWIYRRDGQSLGRGRRSLLAGIRLAALVCLLFMLSEAALNIERTGLPYVVLLLDVSRSMDTPDQYSEPAQQQAARELASGLMPARSPGQVTRLQLVQSLLTRDDAAFLRQLAAEHKLRIYTFAETIDWLGQQDVLQARDLERLVPFLRDLKTTGQESKPGTAIRSVLNELRGQPPAAVVLISDGVATTGDSDRASAMASLARSKGVPLYTIGIGNDEPQRDLALFDTLVDEVAFVGDPITFSVKLKATGFAGQSVTLRLINAKTKKVLHSKSVPISQEREPESVELTYTPDAVGDYDFILEAVPLPKEFRLDNNRETRHVSVRKEKIRILYVDFQPRYEFRYLKNLLEREKTVELTTILQDADPEYSAEDQTAQPHFPVQKAELMKFDVILWGDVSTGYLTPAVMEHVREFVRDQGGGLLFIAGPLHNPAGYRNTPLVDLLPVELDEVTVPSADSPITDSFQPQLTVEGIKGSSIFRLADNEPDSLSIWKSLPGFYWWVQCEQLKPGAKAFATHPVRTNGTSKLPIIAMQRYGAGRVLFHASDETWRWRYRVGDLYYGRYWVQTLRYLSRSRLLGKDKGAELILDRNVYPRGEPVSIRVRFLDDRSIPVQDDQVSVVIEKTGDPQRRVKLTRLPQGPETFEGQIGQLPEGAYHAWVEQPVFSGPPPARDFRVESTQRETQLLRMDRADLTQAAQRSDGQYYNLWDAQNILADLPPGQPVPLRSDEPRPLWNHWLTLMLFCGLLSLEWSLRKRWRLI